MMRFLFKILGVPVHCRELPSGDLSVWHPFNNDAREIVEPICRKHGYWRPSHNNWVIFKRDREHVLALLDQAGE